jgi:hypothetical protein
MRRTAQLLRSLLSILLITAGEGIQFLWLAVSSRAELSAEVLFLRKQLAFYREHVVECTLYLVFESHPLHRIQKKLWTIKSRLQIKKYATAPHIGILIG